MCGSPRPLWLWFHKILCAGLMLGIMMPVADAQSRWAIEESYKLLPEASPSLRQYTNLHYALYAASLAWLFGGLALAVRARLAPRALARWRGIPVWLQAIAVYVALMIGISIWMSPVRLADWWIERAYHLSTTSPRQWLIDQGLALALGCLWAPLLPIALHFVRRSPRWWWLHFGMALAPIGLFMIVVYPVLIDPMFNRFVPLADRQLRKELVTLSNRAGVDEPTVLVSDASRRTKKGNAFVAGIGPTHRIILWNTLLMYYTEPEIKAIIAHELGHYVRLHLWRGFVLQTVGGILIMAALAWVMKKTVDRHGPALGIKGIADPGAIPLALLLIELLLLLQMPLASAVSRGMEREADAYGLQLYRNGRAAASAYARMSTQDYGDPDPPGWAVFWLHTHPSLRERVARALDYDRTNARSD